MASPYSDDLRRKFYEAYQRGDGSLVKLAQRFGVSRSWAEKLSRTVRNSGTVERPAGGKRGPASKLTSEIRAQMSGWIGEQSDLTLVEIQRRLRQQHTLEVSVARLGAVLQEMDWRRKKSHSTPPNRTPPKANSGGFNGGSKSGRSTRRS